MTAPTPAENAELDQGAAFARDAVNLHVVTTRLANAAVGELQSTANLVAMLVQGDFTREALAALYVTAVQHLARRAVSDAG